MLCSDPTLQKCVIHRNGLYFNWMRVCTEGYDDLPYLLLRDRMSTRKAFEAVRGYFFGGVLADFVCMRVCVVCMCMCGCVTCVV